MKKIIYSVAIILTAFLLGSCQDMNHPTLGDYVEDENPVGGTLKFYVAFDGTTEDYLFNAVDSIRANFASANTTTTVDGINGKAIQCNVGKYVSYAKPNDFATTASSFCISFWEKHDGQTHNNALTNGPEYIFSFVSPSTYHWSGSNMFLLFEGNNTACAVKLVAVSGVSNGASVSDTWFAWEGSNAISGLMDNAWHHCAFVYDASTSVLSFYLDGTLTGTKTWNNHGAIGLVNDEINSVRIGCGPQGDVSDASDNWLASTWKGEIDQFRMYGTALTSAEIASLYSAKK